MSIAPSKRAAAGWADVVAKVGLEEWPEPQPLHFAAKPQPLSLADAFPAGCACLREFAEAAGTQLAVPAELPAAMMLPLLSVAIAGHLEVSPWEGWKEPAALWVCGVLPPAERKSAVLQAVYGPLSEWEREQGEEQRPIVAQAEEVLNLKRKRLEGLRARAADDADAERAAVELACEIAAERLPTIPALWAQDVTSEGLASLLVENRGRAVVASAEADPLDVLLGRYSTAPNLGVWLSGHAGDEVRIRRRGRLPEYIKRPALSVALAVQPEGIRPMLESREAAGRGLVARFLFVAPESKVGSRPIRPPAVPAAVAARYRLAVRALLNLGTPGDEPALVEFSKDAERVFGQYAQTVETNLRDGGAFGGYREWAGKLSGAVARIALALHAAEFAVRGFVEGARSTPISAATVFAAMAWGDYFASHFPYVTGSAGAPADTVQAERIMRWAMGKGLDRFNQRDAHTATRRKGFERSEDLTAPLSLLCDLGHLRREEGASERKGGKAPGPVFVVNPKCRSGGGA